VPPQVSLQRELLLPWQALQQQELEQPKGVIEYNVVELRTNIHLFLQFLLLLFFLGALGSPDLLLDLALTFLEGGKELCNDAWALGAILLLGGLLQQVDLVM